MKASKSISALAAGQHQPQQMYQQPQQQPKSNGLQQQQQANSAPTSPICRCRVMYLGSSVPHITKDGLQGIQEPLRELYPDKASLDQGNAGIDSWLSVWSNGILIENVDETGREVKRFFKIKALHYCAAVKFVPSSATTNNQQATTLPSNHSSSSLANANTTNFLPLDSPHARLQQNNTHPPIFASILRRTTGVKVLECHAFICKREAAANALVRCCFHAYADTMYAKQIGAEIDNIGSPNASNQASLNGSTQTNGAPAIMARRSKSIAALNEAAENEISGELSDSSNRQNRQQLQQYSSSVSSRKSLNYAQGGDLSDASQQHSIYSNRGNLKRQQHSLSKSMHHLNQPELVYGQTFVDDFADGSLHSNQSTSYRNLSGKQAKQAGVPEPFFNPYASRIPSYPPQSLIDQQQQPSTGTLRSVKSMAGNSIASTLLRSKKHAKAMSKAQLSKSNTQLNQLNQLNQLHQLNSGNSNRITSFHQPHNLLHHQQMATIGHPGSFMTMPPVPPMFLPNIQRLPQMNGSQTMKLPARHNQLMMPGLDLPMPQINFEAMTPKEMKKLLKKSAKYGIDPSRFTENGLPLLPLRPVPMAQMQPSPAMMPPLPLPPPSHMPPPPPPNMNKSATLGSHYSMDMNQDMPDYGSQPLAYSSAGFGPPPDGFTGGPMQPIKSILVKPNPEFLKSKAGKKWLKQQKEFKKLLPPHLDGLPIVFGPPPLDALEPADNSASNGGMQPPPQFLHPPPPPPPALQQQQQPTSIGLPVMDANGYYNPHPFYGPSERASAASTLLRYSPRSQQQQQQQQLIQHQQEQQMHENRMISGAHPSEQQIDFMQRNHPQAMYSDPSMLFNQQQKALSMNHHHHHQQQHNAAEPMYSSQLGTFDRQFPLGAGPMHAGHHHHQHQMRNHMVEQSVISLGDENDGDDDDEEGSVQREDGNDDDQNGYYDRVGSASSHSTGQQQQQQQQHRSRRGNQNGSADNRNNIGDPSAGDYSETDHRHHGGDDHNSSYSSGIYRRTHINERAFSHSIRQEHKSNSGENTSNSDGDCATDYAGSQRNYHQHRKTHDGNNNKNYHKQPTYDSVQIRQSDTYQDRPQLQYARNMVQQQQHHQPQQIDMDLSMRLDQQLKMKSVPNPGVKSYM